MPASVDQGLFSVFGCPKLLYACQLSARRWLGSQFLRSERRPSDFDVAQQQMREVAAGEPRREAGLANRDHPAKALHSGAKAALYNSRAT